MNNDIERYRSEIQGSVQERVRTALCNPDLSIEQKKKMLKFIRPEQLEFFLKTIPKEVREQIT
ncbi:hypothetical protein NLX71_15380 [Paenibacillus sp. MZ04-78.2]|uniref:hypothetical protein n=1 Tax=Paenibacillus sp. MZ04-78.2 TaxID=2962034 RepID=UPI0020B66D42|nr:hypothetical protein [Paenibacillus sp. MZ04-78.2]MCP3774673.1 hypothetical protein [Paenibacillus sp. MZ04-78.2]